MAIPPGDRGDGPPQPPFAQPSPAQPLSPQSSPPQPSAAMHRLLARLAQRGPVARDTNQHFSQSLSFGERLADKVASFGGSWAFIIAFGLFLALWTLSNLALALGWLGPGLQAFDPYPFIFLNLMLSMLAAIQAPIIMMSQNRQAAKDRMQASHDYEVNLKAEIEIMALHDKLDRLRNEDLQAMLAQQQEQIALLRAMIESRMAPGADSHPLGTPLGPATGPATGPETGPATGRD